MTGREIRQARVGLGLSVSDLARLLGLNTGTIYRWERPAALGRQARMDHLRFSILHGMASLDLDSADLDRVGIGVRAALNEQGIAAALHRLLGAVMGQAA